MSNIKWIFIPKFIEIECVPFVFLVLFLILMFILLFIFVKIELNKMRKEVKNEK